MSTKTIYLLIMHPVRVHFLKTNMHNTEIMHTRCHASNHLSLLRGLAFVFPSLNQLETTPPTPWQPTHCLVPGICPVNLRGGRRHPIGKLTSRTKHVFSIFSLHMKGSNKRLQSLLNTRSV